MAASSTPQHSLITKAYPTWAFIFFFCPQPRHDKFSDFGKMPQKNASHNPVTHPHLQLWNFPLCRSDSPGTVKSTGISVTWAPLLLPFRAEEVTLSFFFSTAFLHPLFARGTHCASKTMRRAVCFLMAMQPRPKLLVGNNKVTPCFPLAGPGHSPVLLLCSAWRAFAFGHKIFLFRAWTF